MNISMSILIAAHSVAVLLLGSKWEVIHKRQQLEGFGDLMLKIRSLVPFLF